MFAFHDFIPASCIVHGTWSGLINIPEWSKKRKMKKGRKGKRKRRGKGRKGERKEVREAGR